MSRHPFNDGWFGALQAQEDRDRRLRGYSWDQGAEHFAANHAPDYPEHRVIAALKKLRWPERKVGVGELRTEVELTTPPREIRAWRDDAADAIADLMIAGLRA